ncbi:MAG: glycerol-3-phosphate 1-O-acyltransferase PlsY [Planctomycetota bacterium]|nr:glycerol-3-phosphate 1-O-acyltransferase PlsY [Planctomycetota bacterium]
MLAHIACFAFAFVLLPLAAYVIGSTPVGVLIARAHKVNLRTAGSGNVGATNVGRAIGRPWGYLCFFLDLAKGFVPTVAVVWFYPPRAEGPTAVVQIVWLLVGCGAIMGHVFSLWLKFRGGKGVATALGVVLGIFPYFTYAGLAALGLWIAVVLISRYVSLASVVAAVAFVPLFVAFNWPVGRLWPMGLFVAAMALLILLRHRSNIRRLIAGTENKIGRKM